MQSQLEKLASKRPEVKPVEIDRWEGEGGNPPLSLNSRRKPGRTISGILRKLLIDWHILNSLSAEQN